MASPLLLRWLVLASWALAIAAGVIDLAVASALPAPLRAYVESTLDAPFTWVTGLETGLTFCTLALCAYGSVLLLRLRRAGRTPFATSYIVGILVTPLYGPTVLSGWAFSAAMLSCVVGGVLLGWLYLGTPPLKRTAGDELDERVQAIERG